MNIRNQNPEAERIGRQQLGTVLRSIGLSTIQDTDQLIGGQLQVKLIIKPADGQYEARNEVKAYKALDGAASAAPAAFAQRSAPAQASAAPAKAAPPWAKK